VVRAEGLEPSRAFAQRIFLPATAFAAAPEQGVCGLDYPFTLAIGFRCCPSSLYTFPFKGLARDRHLTGFPEFGQFCIPGFPKSTQAHSSPMRLPIPPRPRGRST
jgi:hypothetical protein